MAASFGGIGTKFFCRSFYFREHPDPTQQEEYLGL